MSEIELGEMRLKDIAAMCGYACHDCQFAVKSMGENVKCFFRWSNPDKWPLQIKISTER